FDGNSGFGYKLSQEMRDKMVDGYTYEVLYKLPETPSTVGYHDLASGMESATGFGTEWYDGGQMWYYQNFAGDSRDYRQLWLGSSSAALNQWVHLVAVWNKEDGALYGYINGEYEDYSYPSTDTPTFIEDFFIGGDADGTGSFQYGINCDIAFVRVYDAAKSGAEIAEMYNKAITPNAPLTPDAPTGLVVESSTDSTVTLAAIDGCEYSIDGINWQESATFTDLKVDMVYNFVARVKANESTSASDVSEPLKVMIARKADALLVGSTKVLVAPMEDYEFSVDKENWQAGTLLENIKEANCTVYARPVHVDSDVTIAINGTDVELNGIDAYEVMDSMSLINVRHSILFNIKNMADDTNTDGVINVLDLVHMKKMMAE
ncbi:MAG: hypothetical protein MJ132_05020, partial [Clostridia bacterium]|nr:hypothetical protein [Clostridia bacterium]